MKRATIRKMVLVFVGGSIGLTVGVVLSNAIIRHLLRSVTP